MKGEASDGRAGTAQETTKRARSFAGPDDGLEKRNKLCSKRLVQMIVPHPAQIFVATTNECRRNRAGIAARFDGRVTPKFVRQNGPRRRRFDSECWNEQNKAQPAVDPEALMPIRPGYSEAAKFCGGSIIRMTFKLGTEAKNFLPAERSAGERVQTMKDPESNRDTAAKTTRDRNVSLDHGRKRKRLAINSLKKSSTSTLGHSSAAARSRADDGDKVIESKCDPKAIESWTKVGGGRGYADRDLLLFQRESPENGEREAARALILARGLTAAR